MKTPTHQKYRSIGRSPDLRIMLIILLLVSGTAAAQSPYVGQWALIAGGNSHDAGWRGETAVDGSTFVAGIVSSGSASFGSVSTSGSGDFVLAKYTPEGSTAWVQRMKARIRDVAVDTGGNAYIVGSFMVDAGPVTIGTTTFKSRGMQDGFLAKVAPDGEVLWVEHIGGTGGDRLRGVAVDAEENIYIAGVSNGTIAFGGTTLSLSSNFDLFVAKYAPDGSPTWAAKLGGPLNVENLVIAADGEGNAYVAGGFPYRTTTFGSTTLTSMGGYDAYVVKVSPSGSLLWAASKGDHLDDFIEAIDVSNAGDVYVTKYAFGRGMTLSKYAPSGTLEWEKLGASTSQAFGWGIEFDRTGNVLVTGKFEKNLDFGTNLTAAGDADIYLAAFTPGGELLWIESGGAAGASVEGSHLGADREGNIYLSGILRGSVTFMGVSMGGEPNGDIFVARFTSSPGIVAVGEDDIPGRFKLEQNYPNPFNPVTTIRFTLTEIQRVELVVYDMLGKEAMRLIDGVLQPGDYAIQWNAAQQPSGIYLYRLRAGPTSETRRMALAK